MKSSNTMSNLRSSRRRGFAAVAGIIVIMAVVIVVARFGPPVGAPTGSTVTEEPHDGVTPAAAVTAELAEVQETEPATGPPARPDGKLNGSAMFAFAPITDGVQRMRKPAAVRGLYLNAWAAGSTRKLANLIDVANRTEINTFIIDVKEGGEISYRSGVPLAREIGADKAHIRDIRAVLRRSTRTASTPSPALSCSAMRCSPLRGPTGRPARGWRRVDRQLRPPLGRFLQPRRLGLQHSHCTGSAGTRLLRDPVGLRPVPGRAPCPHAAGTLARRGERSKAAGIREFLLYSRAQLAEYGAPVTADVFGLTVSARDDMGIGQLWEKMLDATDVLLPMVYPSHFAPRLVRHRESERRAVRGRAPRAAARSPSLQRHGERRRHPTVAPGLHAGSAALRPGTRARTDRCGLRRRPG
jgi:hypothetical protein